MSSLAWKLNRLRLMGPAELLWRVRQQLQKKAMSLGWGLVHRPPAPQGRSRDGGLAVADALAPDRDGLVATADALLAGRWDVFSMRGASLGFPPQWNREPRTGTLAPLVLGKSIDYRRESVVGDIKYLWEPSRHLELVTLALAWAETGDARYSAGARELLTSWLDQCPYPMGVHWTSALELAVRLLNWAVAWQLLGGEASRLFDGEKGQALKRRWLDAVFQQAHFIEGYFSKHSSANNHLLGEYMGLFVAAVVWPCWPESVRWLKIARAGLDCEALAQNHADGVNKEQATYYHHEVMDMLLLCHRLGAAHGVGLSAGTLTRLERMAEFLVAIQDAGHRVPMIGDADDARMVRLDYGRDVCPYRSLLASCALLFGRADFKRAAGRLDAKTRRLFGAGACAAWEALPDVAPASPQRAFREGGYYLLGSGWGTADEVRAVVDCGPLGYLSIAAHGHADALAMVLSAGGQELLVDPGTYAYHTQKLWRDYFRATRAHNTVTVDNCDQSEIGGNFMWLRKAQARLLRFEPDAAPQIFEGEHDGYLRLSDGVVHRRRIQFDPVALAFEVQDTLQCRQPHEVALHWHVAEGCEVRCEGGAVLIERANWQLQLRCDGADLACDVLCGEESPPLGWISRRFDERVPLTVVRWSGVVLPGQVVSTRLLLIRPGESR